MELYRFTLEERNGEQEYSYEYLIYANDEEDAWEIARGCAGTFYGDEDECGKEVEGLADTFEFMGGCISMSIAHLKRTDLQTFTALMLDRAVIDPHGLRYEGVTHG